MRVIVAGSRSITDYRTVRSALLSFFSDLKARGKDTRAQSVTIISGGARGVDKLGERFAKEFGLNLKVMPANWDAYGKRAGYLRNEEMAVYARGDEAYLVAFWDGMSHGTFHMIDTARKACIPTHVLYASV